MDGLVTVRRSGDGFLYSLTTAGKKYIDSLDSDYKEQYLAIINMVHKKYSRKNDTTLLKEISEKALGSLRRNL
ncbi:MAG: ABC-three component system middle component 2 [Scardovia wiggsiae]